MTAEIIDGRKIAAEVRDDLKQRIGHLVQRHLPQTRHHPGR